eukprot:Skav221607  [mRNA]  locus=scaffold1698:863164:868092:+ [translate_table: standard]
MLPLLFATFFRVGEAKIPGPFQGEPTWSIGVCNPSGVLGKSALLADVNADLLAISETHLTSTSREMFETSLRAQGSYQFVVTGMPLQARFVDSAAGQWSGVAFASRYPCRALSAHWPADMWETGRVQITGTFVGTAWITGAVLYGYPQSKLHKNPLKRTQALLRHLVEHMLLVAVGPRYICGDWNHELTDFEVVDLLLQHGWREVQDLQKLHHGTPIQPTCKGKSRKDFCWISPELCRSFRNAEVIDDTFKDHAVIKATFAVGKSQFTRFVWPTPQPVPWQQSNAPCEVESFAPTGDPTDQYRVLWRNHEQAVAASLGVGWNRTMGGRGDQCEPRRVVGWVPPPKKGRTCDALPGFHGYNIQHCRWMKQLRRLENFVRWARARSADGITNMEHGLLLWNSVLTATGFWPSFQKWWPQRNHHGVGDITCIPTYMPSAHVAAQILETFLHELRWLEQQLRANTKQHESLKHKVNPNLIYRDVKRPKPEPVTSLLQVASSQVVQVDPEDCAIVVDPPQEFDADMPLTVQGRAFDVVHATPDKLYLNSVDAVQVDDHVQQETPVGALTDIFDAFHTQWQRRWCRHDGLPNTHWREIVEFSFANLEHRPTQLLQIDAPLLRAEASHKKATTASGLDGISRADLLTAPDSALESLVCMYDRATTTGIWPKQVLAGKVASLAKRTDSCGANDYRPITVFSLVYRCFSSLHARSLLDWASTWCDADIHGNRKAHQTAHLWGSIVQDIQLAYDQNRALSGLTADIEKAFNCLPRWPILCCALASGTPYPLVGAWAGALAQMIRHFKVRDSYSPGFPSSTGLAEGCALSCFGMLLLDHVCHRWFRALEPSIRMLSFVDNWDYVTWNREAALLQFDHLVDFCSLVDLTIDRNKTFAWSTHAATRTALRRKGLTVKHHTRDLGAHIAMSRQHTNCSQTQRIADLDSFWTQLRNSKAGYHQKLRALRTVAFPRGLHAISNANLGGQHWVNMRRQANKALLMQKPGVNPLIHLGLVAPAVDPLYVAIMHTLRDARQFRSEDYWASEVYPAAVGDLQPIPTSPVAILLDRVQLLGWTMLSTGEVSDEFGKFHPAQVNYLELEFRVAHAWQQYVAAQVSHRPEFAALGSADVHATRQQLYAQTVDDQALLRLSLSGGLFTQDAHKHWNDTEGKCQWCDQADSLYHRYFQCSETKELREQHAPTVLRHVDSLPKSFVLRGWALRPPSWKPWMTYLANLPTAVLPLYTQFSTSSLNIVFTDGSCHDQHLPGQRFAAWGALLAAPCSPGWDCEYQGILGASVLPGISQTAYRAELYAVAYVLHHAAQAGVRILIFCDCLGVVNRLLLLLAGSVRVHPNKSNSDLWFWILESVLRLGSRNIGIRKTKAHRDLQTATTLQDAWEIWNNGAVDRIARAANMQRSSDFWELRRDHSGWSDFAADLHKEVVQLHLVVARHSVIAGPDEQPGETVEAARPRRSFEAIFDRNGWDGIVPHSVLQEYGVGLMQLVNSWWLHGTQQVQPLQVQWVTFAHLYVDFQLAWGHCGPVKAGKRWLDHFTRPYMEVEKHPFLVRLKWFRRLLKVFWQASRQTVSLATCKGVGDSIQSYIACAAVSWDCPRLQIADQWLMKHLRKPCLRGTKELTFLPVASKSSQMAIPATSGGMD